LRRRAVFLFWSTSLLEPLYPILHIIFSFPVSTFLELFPRINMAPWIAQPASWKQNAEHPESRYNLLQKDDESSENGYSSNSVDGSLIPEARASSITISRRFAGFIIIIQSAMMMILIYVLFEKAGFQRGPTWPVPDCTFPHHVSCKTLLMSHQSQLTHMNSAANWTGSTVRCRNSCGTRLSRTLASSSWKSRASTKASAWALRP
jgi:hypothetical protein